SHPALGVVVYVGPDEGLHHLRDGAWVRSDVGPGAPPRSLATTMAFSPAGGALLRPRRYAVQGAQGPDQSLFPARRDGGWSRFGAGRGKRPLEGVRSSGGWPVLVAGAAGVVAVGWRHTLFTLGWGDGDGWTTRLDEASGDELFAAGSPEGSKRAAL